MEISLIKQELAAALHTHIMLLKDIDSSNTTDALPFVVRHLGFMLERIPDALISSDDEDTLYAAFQYYNLLMELKHNLQLHYPYDHVMKEKLANFPTDYLDDLNQWWEDKTGLKVKEPTKQTLTLT